MRGRGSGGPGKAGGSRPPQGGGDGKDWIASQLKRVYDEALEEEIPPEMLALLEKLDGKPDGDDA